MSIPKKLLITSALVAVVGLGAGIVLLQHQNQPQHPVLPAPAVSDLTVDNLLKDVNAERVKAGLNPLAIDPRLNQTAQEKADEIKQTGVFEHISPSGHRGLRYIDEAGIQCKIEGENLAEYTTSAQQTVTGWYNSPTHKEIMLDPVFENTGFGISNNGTGYIIVEHFCQVP